MNDGCTIGRIGCTKHPNRAESLRSGRTSNMVAPVEALDERQTPVQWALSEAVRDFILHSRAVGKGQPRSYDDPPALKLPPPWPVEDARYCEVTVSGSVSRFYASDRLTPPQIATLEGKRRNAAILALTGHLLI